MTDTTEEENHKILRWSRRLSFVPRWTVAPLIRRQSVAEHCFHVARTSQWLLQYHVDESPEFELEVIRLALDHDDAEAATGDAPSPGKTRCPPDQLGKAAIVVKCADVLEAMAFIQEEISMGNRHGMVVIYDDLINRFSKYWYHFPLRKSGGPEGRLSGMNLITTYLEQIVSVYHPHPVLEPSNA